MDNLYFVKLPSNTVPSASGNNVVICETQDGKLYWCDSGGKKRLMSVDEEHAVGSHAIQFYGDPTPAAKYGGNWEVDAKYTGHVCVGSGTGFEIGATGGSADAVLLNHFHKSFMTSEEKSYLSYGTAASENVANNKKVLGAAGFSGDITATGSTYTDSQVYTSTEGEDGTGKNMQPYIVWTIWKRVA